MSSASRIETRRAPGPRPVRRGDRAVVPAGASASISGPDWRAEPVPPAHPSFSWAERGYPDTDWRNVVVVADLDRGVAQYQSFDPSFDHDPPRGAMVTPSTGRARERPSGSRPGWDLERRPSEAWIRVAANRPYDLCRQRPPGRRTGLGLGALSGAGEWIFGTQRATDPVAMPESLDPGELASVFADGRFESPRHGGPDRSDSRRAADLVDRGRDDSAPSMSRQAPSSDSAPGIRSRPDPRQVDRARAVGPSSPERGQLPPSSAASGIQLGGGGRARSWPGSSIHSGEPRPPDTRVRSGPREPGSVRHQVDAPTRVATRLRSGSPPPLAAEVFSLAAPGRRLDAEATFPTGARSALISGALPSWECLRQDPRGRPPRSQRRGRDGTRAGHRRANALDEISRVVLRSRRQVGRLGPLGRPNDDRGGIRRIHDPGGPVGRPRGRRGAIRHRR